MLPYVLLSETVVLIGSHKRPRVFSTPVNGTYDSNVRKLQTE